MPSQKSSTGVLLPRLEIKTARRIDCGELFLFTWQTLNGTQPRFALSTTEAEATKAADSLDHV